MRGATRLARVWGDSVAWEGRKAGKPAWDALCSQGERGEGTGEMVLGPRCKAHVVRTLRGRGCGKDLSDKTLGGHWITNKSPTSLSLNVTLKYLELRF